MLSFRVRVAGRADPDASQSFVKRLDGVSFRPPEQPAVDKCSKRSSFGTPWLSKSIVILYQTATVYGIAYASPSASQLSYTFPTQMAQTRTLCGLGLDEFLCFWRTPYSSDATRWRLSSRSSIYPDLSMSVYSQTELSRRRTLDCTVLP